MFPSLQQSYSGFSVFSSISGLSWLRPVAFCLVLLMPTPSPAKVRDYLTNPDEWFRTPEAKQVAEIVESYQSDWGGWPKNIDTSAQRYTGDRFDLHPTFDNSASTDELRFFARLFNATQDPAYRAVFERGLAYFFVAQYPTGGWPQSYPPDLVYHRYITFNDNAMSRVLQFLRDIAQDPTFAFLEPRTRQAAEAAFDRGIECILRCQIRVDGKLTAWCAQHDEQTYEARPARSFELRSLSGSESVGIVRLLMEVPDPRPEIVASVEAAIAWFQQVAVPGMKVQEVPDAAAPKGFDRKLVADPQAAPLWARFYAIKTMQPLFADRDGVEKTKFEEIGIERRSGYSWYGSWPAGLIKKEYPAWKKRIAGGRASSPVAKFPPVVVVLGGEAGVSDRAGWAFGFKKRLLEPTATRVIEGRKESSSEAPEVLPEEARPLPKIELPVYLDAAWWQQVSAQHPQVVLLEIVPPQRPAGAKESVAVVAKKFCADCLENAKRTGVKAIFVTPLPRWQVGEAQQITAVPDDFIEAIRTEITAAHAPLVDLGKLAAEMVAKANGEETARLWRIVLPPPVPQGAAASPAPERPLATPPPPRPSVSLTPLGAERFGGLVAEEAARLLPELRGQFR